MRQSVCVVFLGCGVGVGVGSGWGGGVGSLAMMMRVKSWLKLLGSFASLGGGVYRLGC